MKTEVINLTPTRAKEILKLNKKNRPVRDNVVSKYSNLMKNGQWQLSHQGIAISETDMVLDGQHRLLACVNSNVTIPIMLVTGLPDSAMTVIDLGAKRSTGDCFELLGLSEGKKMASIIAKYLLLKFDRITQRGMLNSNELSNVEKYNIYLQYENEIRDFQRCAERCYKHVRFYTQSEVGGISLYLFIERGYTVAKIIEFWSQVHMLKGFIQGSATRSLSSLLLKYIGGREKISHRYKSAVTVKSWNAYSEGKEIKLLKFADDEEYPIFI